MATVQQLLRALASPSLSGHSARFDRELLRKSRYYVDKLGSPRFRVPLCPFASYELLEIARDVTGIRIFRTLSRVCGIFPVSMEKFLVIFHSVPDELFHLVRISLCKISIVIISYVYTSVIRIISFNIVFRVLSR